MRRIGVILLLTLTGAMAQTGLAVREDHLNIESLKPLNASGSYIHLIGWSPFLAPMSC